MTTQNLMDEQDAFEKVFPLPEHCTRFEGGYAPTSYNAWRAQSFCDRWEGWKARAALTSSEQAAPEVEQEPVAYLVTIQRFDRLDARLVYKLDDLVLNEATKIVNHEPLYTHPQPKREPLSEEDRKALWKALSAMDEGIDFNSIVTGVEKAHGIGVE